jgi:hypothetical protein
MSDLDQPATKRDLADLRPALKHDVLGVRQDVRELGIKVDAYWQASARLEAGADRIYRLAFGLMLTAWAAILGTAAAVLLRGVR